MGESRGKHPPLDAAADEIEDGVEDFARVDGLRPPSRFGLGNQGLDRFHWASVRSVGYFASLMPFSSPKTRGEFSFSRRLLEHISAAIWAVPSLLRRSLGPQPFAIQRTQRTQRTPNRVVRGKLSSGRSVSAPAEGRPADPADPADPDGLCGGNFEQTFSKCTGEEGRLADPADPNSTPKGQKTL